MRTLETYQSNATETPVMRKWIFGALILSLLFHGGLLVFFQSAKLQRFSDGPVEQRLVPRPFHATRIVFEDKKTDEKKTELAATPPKKQEIQVPPEEKPFQDLKATPVAQDPAKPVAHEAEKLDPGTLLSTEQMAKSISSSVQQDVDRSIRNQLIKDEARVTNAPQLHLPRVEGTGANGTPAGFQTIDQALDAAGNPGKAGPILMPSDLLYDYNSSDLRPGAVASLAKLGKLIESNPHASFSIEGHTDSHGPADYNVTLSLRRAESVKQWLVENMKIDPAQIATKGFGSSKLIAPPNGSVDLEQINRRVEIVIHQHSSH